MPQFDSIGPSSTPQMYLENQYQLLQKQTADWERGLQSQGLDEESYAKAISEKQEELNKQVAFFQAKSQELQQTQSMMDLGQIDEDKGMEAKWTAILPDEVKKAMFPKPEDEPDDSRFSPGQMEKIGGTIKQFASQTPKSMIEKRYGAGKTDWLARDKRGYSQADTTKKYLAWRTYVGYDGMAPIEKKQVDMQWDDWIAGAKGTWKWNPKSDPVKALRARGPLTKAYGSQFNKTPIGPNEAANPLQMSIAGVMPKKKQNPTAQELRSMGTQEAYNQGIGLGYWK